MKKIICLLLSLSILLAGCAGTEPNLVHVRQLGDDQKTCEQLRTEMYFTENEISRLLPKSDKTGKNIALGATGILFIVPLFFMDLKQGEKKEIEAYRQRYNHLLMITQQKDCKLPTAVTKETNEKKDSAGNLKTCKNCEQLIGNLEKAHTFNDHAVCVMCYEKLTKQADAKK